ncbi:hypothetical protein F3J44_11360 [Pantoea sp. Tr-811]|nr:hypothetical protein [Pantoea sp. Tr-811]
MGNSFSPLAVLASCLMASVAAQAQEATFAVDIPAQRLDRSLNELARQTGSRILFATDTAERQQARAVQGQMTVEQALLHLLAGSGLSAQRAGEGYLVGSAASMNWCWAITSPATRTTTTRCAAPRSKATASTSTPGTTTPVNPIPGSASCTTAIPAFTRAAPTWRRACGPPTTCR